MDYIKLFIKTKKNKNVENKEGIIENIFLEPLEDIFEDSNYIKKYFKEFSIFSKNNYDDLIKTNTKIDSEYLSKIIENAISIKEKNYHEYQKNIFLFHFLSKNIEE